MSDGECFDWLFYNGGDYLDGLRDIREGIDGLPTTAVSYYIGEVSDIDPVQFTDEMFLVHGSWPLPDRVVSGPRNRWVNPRYVHRRAMCDIVVRCGCGAVMGRERDRWGWVGESNHSSGCDRQQRRAARRALFRRRRNWIRRGARLHLTQRQVGARMGLTRASVANICSRNGIDWMGHRRVGKNRMARTWRRLATERGYTSREIGAAFGRPASTVRAAIHRL